MKPLPCPFCGDDDPEIRPENPMREGDAWAAVVCINPDCPTYDPVRSEGVRVDDGEAVADDRGSDAYKAAAIARWNTRPQQGRRDGG